MVSHDSTHQIRLRLDDIVGDNYSHTITPCSSQKCPESNSVTGHVCLLDSSASPSFPKSGKERAPGPLFLLRPRFLCDCKMGCEGRGSEGQSLFKGTGRGGHGRLSALNINWSWVCLNDLLKIDYKAFKSVCPDQNRTIKASSLPTSPSPPVIRSDSGL